MSNKSINKDAQEEPTDKGRFAYEGLDRLMHEKGRLAIMTSLVSNPAGLLFGELKRLTLLTDGNLSRHLEVLREAGLVEIWKGYDKKRPQTLCRITQEGREKFAQYLRQLEQVINDAREQEVQLSKSDKVPSLPGSWIPT